MCYKAHQQKHHYIAHLKKSVYYVGSKLWNDLDENIRAIKDLGDFEKNIKAMLMVKESLM